MKAFSKYSEQLNSLMTYVISNNIDISSQEKFTEAMRTWYISQRKMDSKIEELSISEIKYKLNLNF